jgi:hypothetical protein
MGLEAGPTFRGRMGVNDLGTELLRMYYDDNLHTFYVALAEHLQGAISEVNAKAMIAVFTDAINRAQTQ